MTLVTTMMTGPLLKALGIDRMTVEAAVCSNELKQP
jgi:hypothetical protein